MAHLHPSVGEIPSLYPMRIRFLDTGEEIIVKSKIDIPKGRPFTVLEIKVIAK